MKSLFKTSVRCALLGTACAAIVAPACAQDADQGASGLSEIVVTARKTSENLQEVPISITAVSAENLEQRGITNVSQIADFAPNVTLDGSAPISGSSSALVAYIRGIGQSDYAMNFEPGVGLYVDGVYIARNVGGVMDLLDLDRIEILKGPQGTLFGRNTIGGAISLVTKRPSKDFGARLEATTGRYNRLDLRGSMNIPLAETLFASVSFSTKNRDGFVQRIPFPGVLPADQANFRSIDNGILNGLPSGNDLGNENSDTIRANLLWEPGSDTEVRLIADYTRTRENAAPSTLVTTTGQGISGLYNACVAGAPLPVCGSITNGLLGGQINPQFTSRTPYDNRFVTPDRYTTYGNSIAGTKLDVWGISLDVNHDLSDAFSLRSITAYRKMTSIFGEDADMSPLVIDHHGFQLNQDQFSQELQLTYDSDNFKWLAGLYYFNEAGENNDLVPLGGGLFQVFGPNDIRNKSYAAFTEGTFNFTERLSANFGVRYTAERKRFVGGQRDLNDLSFKLGVPLAAFPVPSDTTILFPPGVNRQSFNDVSIRGGVQYKLTDDIFTYVSYSEGFKAGGWDTRLTGPELVAPSFQPETARSWEAGVKSEFANRSVRFNIAAFSTDYRNLQLVVQRGISPLTTNAGSSKIRGVEVDLAWAVTPSFQLSASYGYIDAKYTRLDARANAAGIFLTNQFVNTPENTFSLAADYRLELSGTSFMAFHLDYSWRDDTFNDAVNTPQLVQEDYGIANATVRYSHDDRWYLGGGVTNLLDKRYIVSGFNQPGVGFIYETHARPREWYLQIGYNF
ncbi:TonB-dependent receptor [Blastomonas sp. AAP53]|uniref:TonB-dependent receptor n=1 Tax=Blastomonas sp. AAP53 TaxID=1248760 RepID=UPI0002F5A94D|nr:TonB-dependent receptor [Blastomonas sp. AAP53]